MSRATGAAGPHRAGVVIACATLALAAGFAGCGDDEEEGTPTTTPTIEPATPTGPTGAAGEEGTRPGDDKPPGGPGDVALEDGTVAPPPESDSQVSGGSSAPEDSAENDVPPDPGSAEEEFEKFCDDNPGAC